MSKRTKTKTPARKVTSADEQREIAEVKRYRASVRRIQEIERLAKKMRTSLARVKSDTFDLAVRIIGAQGVRAMPIEPPAAASE